MSMAALKGDTAFQARSLVRPAPSPPPLTATYAFSVFNIMTDSVRHPSTVPLPPPTVFPVRRVQLPGVRKATH